MKKANYEQFMTAKLGKAIQPTKDQRDQASQSLELNFRLAKFKEIIFSNHHQLIQSKKKKKQDLFEDFEEELKWQQKIKLVENIPQDTQNTVFKRKLTTYLSRKMQNDLNPFSDQNRLSKVDTISLLNENIITKKQSQEYFIPADCLLVILVCLFDELQNFDLFKQVIKAAIDSLKHINFLCESLTNEQNQTLSAKKFSETFTENLFSYLAKDPNFIELKRSKHELNIKKVQKSQNLSKKEQIEGQKEFQFNMEDCKQEFHDSLSEFLEFSQVYFKDYKIMYE